MRLPRFGRSRNGDDRVPAEVRKELDAVDAALANGDVPADLEDLGLLAQDLREMRPEAGMRFEAEMDEWAADGFPRGERPGVKVPPPSRGAEGFLARFSPLGPRGWAPVAATATAVVVLGVSVAQLGESGSDGDVAGDGGAVPDLSRDEAGDAAAPSATSPGETGGGETDSALNQPETTELPPGPSAPSFEDASRLELRAPESGVQGALEEAVTIVEARGGIVTNSRAVRSGDESAEIEALIPVEGFAETLDEVETLGSVDLREETQSSRFRQGRPQGAPNGGPLLAPAVITIAPAEVAEAAVPTADDDGDDDGAVETGVGILVISLAILIPLGLLTVAAYIGFEQLSRRARERALGD